MTILDDGSNWSILMILLAGALIGGIAGAIRGTILLRRLELDGTDDHDQFDAIVADLFGSASPGADAPHTGPWGQNSDHDPRRPWWTP